MEKDRSDKFLYEKSLSEIQEIFAQGKIPGDYATWSSSEKKFVPFEWKKKIGDQVINNTMAPACFLCHSNLDSIESHVGILNFRMSVLSRYFAGADTAASGFATKNSDNTFTYDLSYDVDNSTAGLQINHNVIGRAEDKHCGQCHGGGWDDINGDGKINPMDFVIQVKDPKYLQPDFMKEAKVWYFNTNFTDNNGIPKNVEVHQWADYVGAQNIKGCVDCHAPVEHKYIGTGYFPETSALTPSHDFAKGNAGPAHGVMWHQMAGTASCENCHTNPEDFHASAFGPKAKVHMDKIACTTCHIGKKYFYRVKLIDWTLPMWVVGGDANNIVFKGLDKNGYLYGDPENGKWPDVAWFPQRDPQTGKVTWKLKSVNAMGVLYFEDDSHGDFRPVLARYLAKAFRLSPNLPTKYILIQVDEDGNPVRSGDKGIFTFKVKKNAVISEDSDLQSGGWKLWRALPNYIDVNLNGQYDEGVDVEIKDDAGLYADEPDGAPEINTKGEVESAINTLKKVIEKATGKSDVVVKVAASTDAFAMTHNIRPASEALTCADCHAGKSDVLTGEFFARTTPLYFKYDPEVEKASYFDKKIDRAPTELAYAEYIKEELTKAGYGSEEGTSTGQESVNVVVKEKTEREAKLEVALSPQQKVDIQVVIEDSSAAIEDVVDETEIPQLKEKLGVKSVIAALKVRATSKFRVRFNISGLDPNKLDVKTDKGAVVDREISGSTLTATIDPTRADDTVTVALVETEGTSSTGGGGGGGCSLSTAPGFGGALSSILGLLPLALLRRRKRN